MLSSCLRFDKFGLGFTYSIRVMYLNIIYVCKLSNGGVFYKEGIECFFIVSKWLL